MNREKFMQTQYDETDTPEKCKKTLLRHFEILLDSYFNNEILKTKDFTGGKIMFGFRIPFEPDETVGLFNPTGDTKLWVIDAQGISYVISK